MSQPSLYNPRAVEALMAHMTPEDQQGLVDLTDYLHEVAQRPDGSSSEGSVAAIINRQSPGVRQAMQVLSDTIETPRHAPFQEKWTERDYAERLGLDPETTELVKASIDGQEVMSRLNERMGTDADLPLQEPTTRDTIAAAFDFHNGGQHG